MADIIVYMWKNKLEVVNTKTGETVSGSEPFTTERLLMGDFPVAERLLSGIVKKMVRFIRPRLIIQPFEMIEGGLSHVEERALIEMGQIAGARKVKIYIGEKLTPEMFDVVFRRS